MSNEQPKTLEDFRRKVVTDNRAEVIRAQESIMEFMFDPEFQPNAQIPEDVFEYYFLDFFKNSRDEKYKNSPILLKWVELAGGYCHEVDIIGSDGVLLFTVPAITPTSNVNLKGLSESRLDSIVASYKDENKFNPQSAIQGLRAQFRQLPHILDDVKPVEEALVRWRNIFLYFERKKQKLAELESMQNQQFSQAIENTQPSDTVSYNPLKNEDLGINYDD